MDIWKKTQNKIKRMPTKKLLEERKTYNPEFKAYSAKVLRERGIKIRKKPRKQSYGFNLWGLK